jgi:hypothetical protein
MEFASLLSRIGCTSEPFFLGVMPIETFDLEYTTERRRFRSLQDPQEYRGDTTGLSFTPRAADARTLFVNSKLYWIGIRSGDRAPNPTQPRWRCDFRARSSLSHSFGDASHWGVSQTRSSGILASTRQSAGRSKETSARRTSWRQRLRLQIGFRIG